MEQKDYERIAKLETQLESVTEGLKRIENKLDAYTANFITRSEAEIRFKNVEKELIELKDDKRAAILSIEFTAYVALAVLLYAIRQATNLSNHYIPIVAVVLGVAFSIFENNAFSFEVMVNGLQYALYGIGSVAAIKYALEKVEGEDK